MTATKNIWAKDQRTGDRVSLLAMRQPAKAATGTEYAPINSDKATISGSSGPDFAQEYFWDHSTALISNGSFGAGSRKRPMEETKAASHNAPRCLYFG